ncbi:112aa long hypothetical protein [Pyrococcus horikoshii OT3]|uniref:Uncharacterized protein n=1 Tax=Pyrococcus horikoshii (strain ATCC 700860 / DSM 12428 / JCM 9974 / NBRC 100139 / OT-3) TaxID=70601 RepID=O58087_PYRHO|nr:112aa long hypothetical protein [Pyrococcus horikoshii OT3]
MIATGNSSSPSMAKIPIKAPRDKVPVSPGNILAGYLFQYKKPKEAKNATNANFLTSPSLSRAITRNIIDEVPTSSPLNPASMFTRLAETTMYSQNTSNAIIPSLILRAKIVM